MGVLSRLRGKRMGGRRILECRKRVSSWAQTLERYAEAAGIAQEGQTDQARGLVRELLAETRKILVVTGADGGSMELRRYAVSLAKRLGCEIWHLSCVEFRPQDPLKSWSRDVLGVPYQQISMEGPREGCVDRALRRLRRVEFVLVEEAMCEPVELGVPVFLMLREAEG